MALAVTRVILRCEEAQETQVLGINLNMLKRGLGYVGDVTVSSPCGFFSSNNQYFWHKTVTQHLIGGVNELITCLIY